MHVAIIFMGFAVLALGVCTLLIRRKCSPEIHFCEGSDIDESTHLIIRLINSLYISFTERKLFGRHRN